MSVEICEHGDIKVACLDCLDGTPPPKAKVARPRPGVLVGSGYVIAQFEGHCPECDEGVEVGEKILETHRGSGRWGHAVCVA